MIKNFKMKALALIAFCLATYAQIYAQDEPPHEQFITAIIEIPAGETEKWEMDKKSKQIVRDSVDGKARSIHYLGYPANYGMIEGTLLAKKDGGDGDPLDVIVLGDVLQKGARVNCKVLGVLSLLDGGEQDDKIIAAEQNSSFYNIDNLEHLNQEYQGLTTILELWYTNYKGKGKMVSEGFKSKEEALEIISRSKIQ